MKNSTLSFKFHFLVFILSFSLLLASCSTEETANNNQIQNTDPTVTDMVKTELMAGATIVRRKCSNCHFLDKKMRKVGPGLAGIYMSKPRSKGLPFEVWDEQALDRWLTDPIAVKRNTPMAISGLRDPEVRAQVIAYLKKI